MSICTELEDVDRRYTSLISPLYLPYISPISPGTELEHVDRLAGPIVAVVVQKLHLVGQRGAVRPAARAAWGPTHQRAMSDARTRGIPIS